MSPPPLVRYWDGMFSNEPLGHYSFIALASELKATCYHEASHAVVDYMFGRPLSSVGVAASYEVDDGGELTVAYHGEVKTRGPDKIRVDFDYRGIHLMLGTVAAVGPAGERRYRHEVGIPQRLLGASEGDHRSIDAIAKMLERRGRCRFAYQRMVWKYAQMIVAAPEVWSAISAVADDLYSEAALDLDRDEPGDAWIYLAPSHVYRACRRNGLRRGMLRAA